MIEALRFSIEMFTTTDSDSAGRFAS